MKATGFLIFRYFENHEGVKIPHVALLMFLLPSASSEQAKQSKKRTSNHNEKSDVLRKQRPTLIVFQESLEAMHRFFLQSNFFDQCTPRTNLLEAGRESHVKKLPQSLINLCLPL